MTRWPEATTFDENLSPSVSLPHMHARTCSYWPEHTIIYHSIKIRNPFPAPHSTMRTYRTRYARVGPTRHCLDILTAFFRSVFTLYTHIHTYTLTMEICYGKYTATLTAFKVPFFAQSAISCSDVRVPPIVWKSFARRFLSSPRHCLNRLNGEKTSNSRERLVPIT